MTDAPRIALITGASRGIGRAAALACARAGMHVVATARAQKALESLDDEIRTGGGRCTLVPMDLMDGDAIDRLGAALHARHGRLDVLVHAAAHLGQLATVGALSPRDADRLIGSNLTATWRLIRSMEPLLMAASGARALFFTSGVVANPRPHWGLYAATKAGTEALVACWAQEVAFKGVHATVLNPGPVATAMRRAAFPGEDPATLPPPEALASLILELTGPEPKAKSGAVVHFRDTAHFQAWEATRA
jgi:NAD(P)-dependent dehydrogenase (short-subunit alcohol dehydrogenase family)